MKKNQWVRMEDEKPDIDGILCIVKRRNRGYIEPLVWCEHYQNWDDSTGDDFECHKDDVAWWFCPEGPPEN